MKTKPKYTEFRRAICETGWKALNRHGKWVDVSQNEVIDYLLFRNFHNENALQVSAQTQMCVHCEGWMRLHYAKEAIQYKPNMWLHVTCVPQWLTTTCDPEAYEETEWGAMAERFARWFMRASRTPEVMNAHRCLSQHFGESYTNELSVISNRH